MRSHCRTRSRRGRRAPAGLLVALALCGLLIACFVAPGRAAASPEARPPLAERVLQATDADADEINALVERIHAEHPQLTELHVLGESVRGRPVLALAIGRDLATRRDRPALLLEGGIHGDEPLAPVFVLDAAVMLLEDAERDPEVARWLDEIVVWCVPLLNPDGRHARHNRSSQMGRKNGRDTDRDGHWDRLDGVDLNRNFPFVWGATHHGSRRHARHEWFRGPEPASEPETRALMRLAESERFFASVSYHMGADGLLVPYTTEAHGVLRAPLAWTVARDLAADIRSRPGQIRWPLKRNLYPVDGADQDWLYARFGTLALLLEGGRVSPRGLQRRRRVVAGSRGVWQGLVRRYLDGPALSGVVVDAAGQPVAADLQLAGVARQPWERWSTRCRDGRFDRFVAAPGSYVLRVHPRGTGPVLDVPVEVAHGRTELEIRLPGVLPSANRSLPRCEGPGGWTAPVLRPLADPGPLRAVAERGGERLSRAIAARTGATFASAVDVMRQARALADAAREAPTSSAQRAPGPDLVALSSGTGGRTEARGAWTAMRHAWPPWGSWALLVVLGLGALWFTRARASS